MKEKKVLKISILVDKTTASLTINKLIASFIDVIKDKVNDFLDYDIKITYLLDNNNILFCKNCKKCFKENVCLLDNLDGMGTAKTKLIETDLLIIACPVYENNVSAFIKAFLDRVGYWCHLMPMLGTKCVIMVTAKSTGYDFVGKYLYDVFSHLGFNIQGILYKNIAKSDEDLLKELESISKKIIDDISKHIFKNSNLKLENIYEKYKYIYLNFAKKNLNSFEYKYWLQFGKIDSYQELIELLNQESFTLDNNSGLIIKNLHDK